ncbi:MAG: SO_0444 family Cu/Zn efflux transporter [Abditibacteriota bacterium]|nr:SO_0444 family Cu/Zn efflux transporter [Abditibacteriota bacterium]
MSILQNFALKTWELTTQMAPYILFGYLMAGVIRLFLSVDKIKKYLGDKNPLAVLWAALLGVPLPLCSCGILPVAASLKNSGAGRGAVASFLLSTPQTGIDNIIATYGLMGRAFALWRPVQAFLMGLLGGSLIQWLDKEPEVVCDEDGSPEGEEATEECCCEKEQKSCCCEDPGCDSEEKAEACECENEQSSCCCETKEPECCCEEKAEPECECGKEEETCCCEKEQKSCCCGKEDADCSCCGEPKGKNPVVSAFVYAFWQLPAEIGGHLLLGLVIAGLFSALFDPGAFRGSFGGLWGQIGVCVLLGLPMYVCSTASIPLAYSLIQAGFEPGAALVFMVTGPETNLAAFPVLHKILGGRGMIIYLACVILTACICGLLLNGFLSFSPVPGAAAAAHSHAGCAWGVLLLAVLVCGAARRYIKK